MSGLVAAALVSAPVPAGATAGDSTARARKECLIGNGYTDPRGSEFKRQHHVWMRNICDHNIRGKIIIKRGGDISCRTLKPHEDYRKSWWIVKPWRFDRVAYC